MRAYELWIANLCQDDSYTEPSFQEIDKEKHLSPRLNETKVMLAFSKIKKIASGPDSISHWVWRDNALLLALVVTFILDLISLFLYMAWGMERVWHRASDVILQYLSWSSTNHMPCNLSQFKELFFKKKGQANPSPIGNIEQAEFLVLLGMTFQGYGTFTEHINQKLFKADNVSVLRSLRKEGYNQVETDHLFQSLVLPKILYGLPAYLASVPELNTVQQFLYRCHKRRYISYAIDMYDLKKQTGESPRLVVYLLIPSINCCPEIKNRQNVRTQTSLLPCVNTEHFKASFINRLYFKYTFTI